MQAYHRDRKKHIALLLNSGADDADDRAAAARVRLPILTESDRKKSEPPPLLSLYLPPSLSSLLSRLSP